MAGKIIGAMLIVAVGSWILKSFGWRGAPLIGAFFTVYVIGEYVGTVGTYGSTFSRFLSQDAVGLLPASVKLFGIAFLGSLGTDLCDELGEERIGKVTGVLIKAEMLGIVLPILLSAVEDFFSGI